MRKSMTFRIDSDLVARARLLAQNENRSLTNLVEAALLCAIEQLSRREPDSRRTL